MVTKDEAFQEYEMELARISEQSHKDTERARCPIIKARQDTKTIRLGH